MIPHAWVPFFLIGLPLACGAVVGVLHLLQCVLFHGEHRCIIKEIQENADKAKNKHGYIEFAAHKDIRCNVCGMAPLRWPWFLPNTKWNVILQPYYSADYITLATITSKSIPSFTGYGVASYDALDIQEGRAQVKNA